MSLPHIQRYGPILGYCDIFMYFVIRKKDEENTNGKNVKKYRNIGLQRDVVKYL